MSDAVLREAADRMALQHLAYSYCHAVDRRDYGLLRTLYHPDATDDHGAMYSGPASGFVDWLPGMMAHWQATRHSITNMLFLIDGDEAQGELVTDAWHRTLDGTRDIIAHGRYLDRYQRRNGEWKFLHRALVQDWMEERAVPPVTLPDDGVPKGQPGSDDPCYQRLPLFLARRES